MNLLDVSWPGMLASKACCSWHMGSSVVEEPSVYARLQMQSMRAPCKSGSCEQTHKLQALHQVCMWQGTYIIDWPGNRVSYHISSLNFAGIAVLWHQQRD